MPVAPASPIQIHSLPRCLGAEWIFASLERLAGACRPTICRPISSALHRITFVFRLDLSSGSERSWATGEDGEKFQAARPELGWKQAICGPANANCQATNFRLRTL